MPWFPKATTKRNTQGNKTKICRAWVGVTGVFCGSTVRFC